MPFEILRDLRGLKVEVMLPPDTESVGLAEHLQRIGCVATSVWPLPAETRPPPDLMVLTVDYGSREQLRRVCRQTDAIRPTVIAVVGYENPSTLQLVLEVGAHAVIERPIRPFGLLTQLVIARTLWQQQQQAATRLNKLERKLAGMQCLNRARLILMTTAQLTEDEAYKTIRREAMTRRMPLEEAAAAIVTQHEHQMAGGLTER